jgi:hypothetical protein
MAAGAVYLSGRVGNKSRSRMEESSTVDLTAQTVGRGHRVIKENTVQKLFQIIPVPEARISRSGAGRATG